MKIIYNSKYYEPHSKLRDRNSAIGELEYVITKR